MKPLYIALCVLVCTLTSAARAGDDTIGTFQAVCESDPKLKSFSAQVACIEQMIGGWYSSPLHQNPNSDIQLYILTADKLVDDVNHHRLTAAGARLELQRTYMAIRQSELDRAEANAREVALERERAARDAYAVQVAEEAQARDNQAQQAQFRNAVMNCIQIGNARIQPQADASDGLQSIARASGYALGNALGGGGSVEQQCSRNPNWYQTIAPPPPRATVTDCRSDLMGLHCTTR